MHAPIELVGIVGRHAFDAGTAYARQHRAVVRRHDAEARVVTGNVEGSGRNVYSSTAFYDLTRNGTIVSFDGRCSCPVQADCKHTVALLITALEQQRAAQGRPVVSAWRSRLEGIFPDPAATGYEPLALVLDFQAPPPERDTGGHRSAWQVVTEGGLQARPMRRGKRGTWIASGASWAEIQRSAVPSAAPAQLDALTALARMNQASQAYGYGAPTWLDLHRITSRALWPALEDLVAAGVALIEPDGEPAVLLDAPGRAELAVWTRGSAASADGADGAGGAGEAGEDEHHDSARDGDPGDLHLEAVITSE
ncbi:MAG TPA: hypothetical protein DHV14_09785, partial [Micrococcales bacterium]|nr:hypothetical protein [Micrococcales bacterium]